MNDTTMRLWRKVKDNRDRLNACSKHKFDCPNPPYKLGMKLVCLNCGAEMRGEAIFEYMNGFIAAGGNPNEVIEGWNE